jgi:hypothetical protein
MDDESKGCRKKGVVIYFKFLLPAFGGTRDKYEKPQADL